MKIHDNLKVSEFLNNICVQIKSSEVHEDIKAEILNHIEEMTEEYKSNGFSEEESINKSIANMGDSDSIGYELNNIYKKSPDWKLITLSSILICSGVLLNYFLTSNTIYSSEKLNNTFVLILIGIPIFMAVYKFDYRKFQSMGKPFYIVATLLLCFSITNSLAINGYYGYFIIFRSPINSYYLSIIAYILSLSSLFKNINWENKNHIIKALVLFNLPIFLYLYLRSYIYALTYVAVFLVLAYYSGSRKTLFVFLGELGILCNLFIGNSGYRLARFMHYFSLKPKDDFISSTLNNLLSNSTLIGQGVQQSISPLPYLSSDVYIIIYTIHIFGWITAITLIVTLLLFILRIFNINKVVKNPYGKFLLLSISTLYFVQITWFILMNFNIVPRTIISLPFVSYGGSYFILNTFLVALVCSIYGRRNFSNNCSVSKGLLSPFQKYLISKYIIKKNVAEKDVVRFIVEYFK